MGRPLTASMLFSIPPLIGKVTAISELFEGRDYECIKGCYRSISEAREVVLTSRMLQDRSNYYTSLVSPKDSNSSGSSGGDDDDDGNILMAIRGDASFVYQLPVPRLEDWIVDDKRFTVRLPEPITVDTDLTRLDTKELEHTKTRVDLRDINVTFPGNRLTLISGPTGSGKSSLLLALMGELCCLKGWVDFPLREGTDGDDPDKRVPVGY
ncbi:hypothetical protein EV182_007801, partial [Spiromyces aspiralis]